MPELFFETYQDLQAYGKEPGFYKLNENYENDLLNLQKVLLRICSLVT